MQLSPACFPALGLFPQAPAAPAYFCPALVGLHRLSPSASWSWSSVPSTSAKQHLSERQFRVHTDPQQSDGDLNLVHQGRGAVGLTLLLAPHPLQTEKLLMGQQIKKQQ